MQSATLRTHQRGGHDELGDGRDVAQFQQITRDDEIPVILPYLFLKVDDAFLRALQTFVGSHDTDVVPHQPPDLVPVVRDHHQFIRVRRMTGLPGRDFGVNRMRRVRKHFHRRAMSADQRFEQRVARQPVRAV